VSRNSKRAFQRHQRERDDTAVPAPDTFDELADQLQVVWNHPDADAR